MASLVNSTKDIKKKLYWSFSNSSKRLKRREHSQSCSMKPPSWYQNQRHYHWLKKMHRLQLKFYLKQNEDCSLGDSTSEKLLWRGREKGYICDFDEGRVHAIKHIFFRRFLLVMRCSHHHEGFLCFLDVRRYKNWAYNTSFWKYLSENTYLYSHFSNLPLSTEYLVSALHPELLSGGVENQQLEQHMI